MIRPLHPFPLALAMVMVVSACGQNTEPDLSTIPQEAFAIVANADVAVGPQRLLVGLVTPDSASHAAPELDVRIDLYPPSTDDPSISMRGVFMWTSPGVRGLYRVQVDLDQAGVWSVGVRSTDGEGSTQPTPFSVAEDGITPDVGESAPSVTTATATSLDSVSEISTDSEPDLRFYQQSLDAAIESGRSSVVVFATPAFCETATCGPMLENVKEVAPDFPSVNFLHVEVYENLDAATRDELKLVEAVKVWRLPSEPWVFVVDAEGLVAAKFEGVMDRDELQNVLDDLS